MPVGKKTKLVYVLPEYDVNTGSHFFHIYELLERASESLDIFLVAERGRRHPHIEGIYSAYVQRFSWYPLRYLELWAVLLWLRLHGWKNFWVYYSVLAAFVAWNINSLLGGKVWYWNCGMPWLYTRGRFAELLFRFVLRHTMLVTGTEGLKNMYADVYGLEKTRVKVMPNWINVDRFNEWRGKKKEAREKLHIPPDKKVILFVHHISKRKGAHRIVPVASQFRDAQNLLFIVVGSGPYSSFLREEIKKQHLENVRLEGNIPNVQIPQYLAASDALFMPSEEEGFPRVLLEAMAMGVPFVASAVGGVREIIPPELKDAAVDSGDISGYAAKIKDFLEKDVAVVSWRLQDYTQRFNLEIVVDDFVLLVSSD